MYRFVFSFMVIIFFTARSNYISAQELNLSNITYWTYNIQEVDSPRQHDALVNSCYDLYVLEIVTTEVGKENFDIGGLLHDIRESNLNLRGIEPIILAYVDVGQLEDWRWYFDPNWGVGNPVWIVGEDPNEWEGNYPVAYWHPDWENIAIYGYQGRSLVEETLVHGFDGIYMDWVEAFSDEQVLGKAKVDFNLTGNAEAKAKTAELMFNFIEKIRNYAQSESANANVDYLVVAQNASDLYSFNPTRYQQIIDAIALEAIWFDGHADVDWDDPDGYNVHTNTFYPGWTEQVLSDLEPMKGILPIFCVEYAQDLGGVNFGTQAYALADEQGFTAYASRRSLSQLSTTPEPPGYDSTAVDVKYESEEINLLQLFQNSPNPFNPETTIRFTLPQNSSVTLSIYDMTGHLVRVLVSETRIAGRHLVKWNGRDLRGRQVSSGIYFCKLRAGDLVQVKKMGLLR